MFYMSKRVGEGVHIQGEGEVGGFTHRLKKAWPCLQSAVEGLGWDWKGHSVVIGINRLRNQLSHLVGPVFKT